LLGRVARRLQLTARVALPHAPEAKEGRMGQVNVNTPGGGTTDPDSSGAGFILGIIVAIIVIAALVYFLVLRGPDNGDTDGGTDGGDVPEPSALVLRDYA
jgi:hypothetical protein